MAEDLYVTQSGTTPFDGTLAHPWRASDFNTSGNWGAGAGKISAGDIVHLGGTFTTKLTVLGSGTNAATRITLLGDGLMTGSGPTMAWTGTTALVGLDGGAFDYIALIECSITQPTSANNYDCISLGGCDGWLIEDNYIHDTYMSGIATVNGTANTTNIIRHNLFYNVGGTGAGFGDGSNPANMSLRMGTGLVEYNTILRGMDRCNTFGTGNVVRQNYWGKTLTSYYPSATQQPPHNDAFQSHEGQGVALIQTLFEKNYDTDNIDDVQGTNAHWMNVQDTSASPIGFLWGLFRFNISIREGGSFGDYIHYSRTYGYNNTFIAGQNGSPSTLNTGFFWDLNKTNLSDISDWRNNTVDFCPNILDSGGIWGSAYRPLNFTSGANHAYNTGAQAGLPASASPANLAQTIPGFTDGNGTLGHDDYTLTSGALLRSNSASMTTANGAAGGGSSTSLTVATGTAYRFFSGAAADGWAAADADWIKIGSGAYVQITRVNVSTDVITLASARNWSNGDAVIVKGQENVGALPFSYVPALTTPTVTQTTVTASPTALTATSTTPEGVRGVEFLVGRLPIGIAYYDGTGTYSVSNTPSGPQLVEARALNYWSGAVPTVSDYLLVNQDPSSLATGAVTSSGIALTWTDNSAGADSFSIEQSLTGAGSWSVVASPAIGVTSVTISGLASSTTYYFRIRAFSSPAYSGYSSNANATTSAAGGSSAAGVGGKVTIGGKLKVL